VPQSMTPNVINLPKQEVLEGIKNIQPKPFTPSPSGSGIPKVPVGVPVKPQMQLTEGSLVTPPPTIFERGAKVKMKKSGEYTSNLSRKPNVIEGKVVNKATPQNSLINEAKKYKSAEEFVNAQGTPVYHGTKARFKEFAIPKEGEQAIFLTNNKDVAKSYFDISKSNKQIEIDKLDDLYFEKKIDANTLKEKKQEIITTMKDDDGVVLDAFIDKNAKIKTIDNIKRYNPELQKEIINNAKTEGYDVVVVKNTIDDALEVGEIASDITIVLNPEKIKTKSQLEQIWKEANKK